MNNSKKSKHIDNGALTTNTTTTIMMRATMMQATTVAAAMTVCGRRKKKFWKRKHRAQHAQHSRAGNGAWLLGRTIWCRGKTANSACSWLRLPCTNHGQCNRALA
jgi:hypothetical protein